MRQLTDSRIAKVSMRSAMLAVLAAGLMAGPALAQSSSPSPKPKAKAKTETKSDIKSETKTAKKSLTGAARISNSPLPSYDNDTARRISATMLSYSTLEVRGGWPTLPPDVMKLAPGSSGPEVALLRQRLAITDDLPAEVADGDAYDMMLTEAVKRFQIRHGLPETGTVGPQTLEALNVPVGKRLRQLSASMDRLNGMGFTFGQRYVVVNIPAAVAEAVEDSKVTRRYVTVVGKVDRPSPTLTTQITAVNLNPTWTVPLSILKKDIVTKMRKDPGYIGRMKMRVLDGNGNEVDAHAVDWHADRTPNFTVRQDSGNGNALGNVRIDMPNPHSVYMHDTNHKEFFSADYRFQSSGCTRVEGVRDFAAWILKDNDGWSRKDCLLYTSPSPRDS